MYKLPSLYQRLSHPSPMRAYVVGIVLDIPVGIYIAQISVEVISQFMIEPRKNIAILSLAYIFSDPFHDLHYIYPLFINIFIQDQAPIDYFEKHPLCHFKIDFYVSWNEEKDNHLLINYLSYQDTQL